MPLFGSRRIQGPGCQKVPFSLPQLLTFSLAFFLILPFIFRRRFPSHLGRSLVIVDSQNAVLACETIGELLNCTASDQYQSADYTATSARVCTDYTYCSSTSQFIVSRPVLNTYISLCFESSTCTPPTAKVLNYGAACLTALWRTSSYRFCFSSFYPVLSRIPCPPQTKEATPTSDIGCRDVLANESVVITLADITKTEFVAVETSFRNNLASLFSFSADIIVPKRKQFTVG